MPDFFRECRAASSASGEARVEFTQVVKGPLIWIMAKGGWLIGDFGFTRITVELLLGRCWRTKRDDIMSDRYFTH
jgi:hypothetical protein